MKTTKMGVFNKFLLYALTILHSPLTLVRVFVATVIMIDLWCDKTINDYLKGVEKEIEEETNGL